MKYLHGVWNTCIISFINWLISPISWDNAKTCLAGPTSHVSWPSSNSSMRDWDINQRSLAEVVLTRGHKMEVTRDWGQGNIHCNHVSWQWRHPYWSWRASIKHSPQFLIYVISGTSEFLRCIQLTTRHKPWAVDPVRKHKVHLRGLISSVESLPLAQNMLDLLD